MQWAPEAHITDTRKLTLEQQGAYRLLLDYLWLERGWLQDNDEQIARLLAVTVGRWRKIKPAIATYFIYERGKFTQKRLLIDYAKAVEKVEKNRKNGSLGGTNRMKNLNSLIANALSHANAFPQAKGTQMLSEALGHLPKQ